MKTCPSCQTRYDTDANFCPEDGTELVDVDDATSEDWSGREFADTVQLHDRQTTGVGEETYAGTLVEEDRTVFVTIFERTALDPSRRADELERAHDLLTATPPSNVLALHSTDLGHETAPYAIEESASGTSLAEVLSNERVLDWSRAARIVVGVGRILQWMADRNLHHYDFRPDYVFVDEDDRVQIGHWYQSVLSHRDAPRDTAREADTYRGPAPYLSPEAIRDDETVGVESGVYTMAMMLYEMLLGKPPFTSQEPGETLERHLDETPLKLSIAAGGRDLPDGLDDWLGRAWAKSVDERFASTGEAVDALSELLDPAIDEIAPELAPRETSPFEVDSDTTDEGGGETDADERDDTEMEGSPDPDETDASEDSEQADEEDGDAADAADEGDEPEATDDDTSDSDEADDETDASDDSKDVTEDDADEADEGDAGEDDTSEESDESSTSSEGADRDGDDPRETQVGVGAPDLSEATDRDEDSETSESRESVESGSSVVSGESLEETSDDDVDTDSVQVPDDAVRTEEEPSTSDQPEDGAVFSGETVVESESNEHEPSEEAEASEGAAEGASAEEETTSEADSDETTSPGDPADDTDDAEAGVQTRQVVIIEGDESQDAPPSDTTRETYPWTVAADTAIEWIPSSDSESSPRLQTWPAGLFDDSLSLRSGLGMARPNYFEEQSRNGTAFHLLASDALEAEAPDPDADPGASDDEDEVVELDASDETDTSDDGDDDEDGVVELDPSDETDTSDDGDDDEVVALDASSEVEESDDEDGVVELDESSSEAEYEDEDDEDEEVDLGESSDVEENDVEETANDADEAVEREESSEVESDDADEPDDVSDDAEETTDEDEVVELDAPDASDESEDEDEEVERNEASETEDADGEDEIVELGDKREDDGDTSAEEDDDDASDLAIGYVEAASDPEAGDDMEDAWFEASDEDVWMAASAREGRDPWETYLLWGALVFILASTLGFVIWLNFFWQPSQSSEKESSNHPIPEHEQTGSRLASDHDVDPKQT